MTTPSGCAHCGLEQRGHSQRWTETAGWHGYMPPTQQQIKDRMNARKASR